MPITSISRATTCHRAQPTRLRPAFAISFSPLALMSASPDLRLCRPACRDNLNLWSYNEEFLGSPLHCWYSYRRKPTRKDRDKGGDHKGVSRAALPCSAVIRTGRPAPCPEPGLDGAPAFRQYHLSARPVPGLAFGVQKRKAQHQAQEKTDA